MNRSELEATATAMVAKGKGILAADESSGTIKKRFDGIKLESTEEARRTYRELLFTAPEAASYISGVILYDETLRQKTKDGTPFPQHLSKLGIVPGIKVDTGAKPLAGFPGETITEGLDGLRERLAEYYSLGARFAKWRAVIDIDTGKGIPSDAALGANAEALARYAALCQEATIVPIVEPEVLMDGAHDIDTCYAVTSRTLEHTFGALRRADVELEGMILKPNMVIPGKKSGAKAAADAIAAATVRCFRRHVPAAVPGIVFLSGGQSELEATANLSAMNALGKHPWELSFSYESVTWSAYMITWPSMWRAARPIVWMSDVSDRRKPSLSASRIATSDTSGKSKPSRSKLMPISTS
jgi:fructose-bisphosphate aldolase class I